MIQFDVCIVFRWVGSTTKLVPVGKGGSRFFDAIVLHDYYYIPGTQMTLVLIGKGLLLEGSTPKTKDKQVPGNYCNYYMGFIGCDVKLFFSHPYMKQ